jgi:hypothetical protein
MSMTWFIDERGEAWQSTSREVFRRLGSNRTGADLDTYLIEQMGFAGVRERPTLFEVHFSAQAVSPIALTGLLYWLTDRPQKPVTFTSRGNAVQVDIARDRSQAVAYVSRLIESRHTTPLYSRFGLVLERTQFAAIWKTADEVVRADMSDEVRARILDRLFSGSYTLNNLDPSSGHYRVTAFGSSIAKFDPAFVARGLGITYHDMSDKLYGKWIAETFRGYSGLSDVAAESVDAAIEGTGTNNRLRYTRLVLPFEAHGRRQLLVATDVR